RKIRFSVTGGESYTADFYTSGGFRREGGYYDTSEDIRKLFRIDGDENSTLVKTKDGKVIGTKEEWMSKCNKLAVKYFIDKDGLKMKQKELCQCAAEELVPTLYYHEISRAVENDNVEELYSEEENVEILVECLRKKGGIEKTHEVSYEDVGSKIDNDKQGFKKDAGLISEERRKRYIENCERGYYKEVSESNEFLTENEVKAYCECTLNKLLKRGYSLKIKNKSPEFYQEKFKDVIFSCLERVSNSKPLKERKDYDKNLRILDDDASGYIPLVEASNGGYEFTITFKGNGESSSDLFLLDTGADGLIINEKFEEKLKEKGVLEESDYVGENYFATANKDIVKTKVAIVDQVQLGGYKVTNVPVHIMEGGYLLCGAKFLDHFANWQFKKNEGVLKLSH
ncbi:MAG: aspartyl protease family protein, partial [Flavobacteriales bacterium]